MTPSETKKWMSSIHRATDSWVAMAVRKPSKKNQPECLNKVFVFNSRDSRKIEKELKNDLSPLQIERIKNQKSSIIKLGGSLGAVVVVFPKDLLPGKGKCQSALTGNLYGASRDAVGTAIQSLQAEKCDQTQVMFVDAPKECVHGALVGIDIANYKFKCALKGTANAQSLRLLKNKGEVTTREINEAYPVAAGVNLARHLVNLPPNVLQPEAYAEAIKKLFPAKGGLKVETWDRARLNKEKCGLILAVGKGATASPQLVHVKYRPKGSASKKPVAFVGKGITFDSGGLNLKSGPHMRLMKKDMGGSAALVGLAYSAIESGLKQPMDFYFCLAENAVNGNSFRPGDVYTSRSGQTVEIDNTDAEGRLVLADGLDVATSAVGKDAPQAVVNVATLTGAVKAGLGTDIGGLFSDDDRLAKGLVSASQQTTDRIWPMPLYAPYASALRSNVADTANSADGFGGAIRAALFLNRFTRNVPWAHFDIYAWADSPSGAITESGGNGQTVQCLYYWCKNILDRK